MRQLRNTPARSGAPGVDRAGGHIDSGGDLCEVSPLADRMSRATATLGLIVKPCRSPQGPRGRELSVRKAPAFTRLAL
jgi:hypothetical protein